MRTVPPEEGVMDAREYNLLTSFILPNARGPNTNMRLSALIKSRKTQKRGVVEPCSSFRPFSCTPGCGFPCRLPPRPRALPSRLYLLHALTTARNTLIQRCYACSHFTAYSLPSRWATTSSGTTPVPTFSMTHRGTHSGTSTVPGTTSLCTFV